MIGVEERRIRIVTEFFEKGKEKIEKSSRRIVETSEQQVRGIKKVHSIQEKVNGRWVEQSRTVKKGIPIIKRFQAQYLSLMFTGMAVYRTFGGIVKTQTELWGINEGFSAMLSIVMIPVMEWLSDVLWPIFDWFMKLPEPVQKVIGFFILLGVVVGALAMVFGMFMLALTATGIDTAISLFGSFLLVIFGIGITLWGVIDIVTNFGKSTVGILKGVGKVLIGIGLILVLFVGWWALIPIAVGAAIWAIAKYWHKLPGYIQKPLIFIYVLLEAFAKYLYATLINPMIAFAKIMYYVFTGQFKKAWATAKDAVTSIIDPFLNIGKRYDELVKKSDKYTEEQNSGMDNIKSKTTNMANDIQSVMGNSLKITQQNFDATTITGQLSAVNIANAWDESSINMSNSMINSANMINEAINTIPSRIETVHETIEITSYGTSSGRSGATIGRDALGQPMTMIPTATPTATPKYVESKFPGVPGYYEYFQGGGWIPKTGPYMLHAGEYVNTIGKANGMGNGTIINLSPIYNVYVSDKREFEMMIKNNNNKLVEDLRRMIEI